MENNIVCSEKELYTIQGVLSSIVILFAPAIYVLVFGVGILFFLTIPLLIVTLFAHRGKACKKKNIPILYDTKKLFSLYCFWVVFSFLWSITFSIADAYSFFKLFILFFIMIANNYSQKDIQLMRLSSIIAAVCVVYVMITNEKTVEVGFLEERAYFVLFGIPQDPNYICILLTYPIVISFTEIINERNKIGKKMLYMMLMFFLIFGIVLSGSRGGLLGISVGIAVSFFYLGIKESKFRLIIPIVFVVVLILLSFPFLENFVPESVLNRFSLEEIFESNQGTDSRTLIWEMYINRMINYPWTLFVGFGKNTGIRITGSAAHSFYIQEFFEIGLIGLVLCLCSFFSILKGALSNNRVREFATLLGIMVMSCSLSTGGDIQFWITVALCYMTSHIEYNREPILKHF